MKAWLFAIRIKTLSASLVPVVVGSCLAFSLKNQFYLWIFLFSLLGATFIQIGTNLINDVLDFKKGADTKDRLGPTRVAQGGLLSMKSVFWAGVSCFVLAFLVGIPLVLHGGWPILIIGVFSLLFGYLYTGGPFPLAYVGLGDIFVIIFFGWIAVGGVFFLHTQTYSLEVFIAGTQVGFLATVLIAINNLRDVNQDKLANKRTMAVRMGKKWTRYEILCLYGFSFLGLIYWVWIGQGWAGVLPLVILPLSRSIIRGVVENEPGSIYNQFLAKASMAHVLFGLQLSLGFLLS